MLTTHPVVTPHRTHLAVLEYQVDRLSNKLSRALSRIFAAQRARLNAARITPTFEIVPVPPINCKHGLREAWCAACASLTRPGGQNPHRDKYLDFSGRWSGPLLSNGNSIAFDAADAQGLDEMESADFLADEGAEEARSAEVAKCTKAASRMEHKAPTTFTPLEEACIAAVKEEILADGRAWQAAHAVRVANVKKQTLAEYVAAKAVCVMLPGLRNGRGVRVREPWEIAVYNAEWTAKNNRKLAARGWIGYSPEAFDVEIIRARQGTVEADLITKFDRDLSRKGNKYHIQ
jgi:hypothetical protein